MNWLNYIIQYYLKRQLSHITYYINHPAEVQLNLLMRMVSLASSTEWGRKYDYKSIRHYSEFKNRVPLQDYDSLKPYIQRMMQGEKNVLWHSKVQWFAKSSGTTSDRSKFIPVSYESLSECHYRAGTEVLARYIEQYPSSKIFSGKGLIMGGSHKINTVHDRIRQGDISAVMIENMPLLASLMQTPPKKIALIDDWEEKIDKIITHTLRRHVTHLVGVPTWTLILLKEILKRTGKSSIIEVWPYLELYIHGGVSFKPYKQQFERLIPKENMYYLETYNASEGFFGMQYSIDDNDLLLMTDHGVFYEFVPIENLHDSNPPVFWIDEVETGKNYALIITTNSGLWRYNIGDTVVFTSKYPFKFYITGRTRHYINAFGEEVIVDNTDKAIAIACRNTGCVVKDYTVAPYYITSADRGCHEWLIEFEIPPSNIEYFTAELDRALQSVNSDYEAKRYKDIALTAPRIHVAKENTFYNWLKAKGKLGGQHKVPRLSNDRNIIEDIMRINH